jgi:hypothetical protein
MSGSFAGSRALDDRRRRRLAVNGDGTGDGDTGGLGVLRERNVDLPAASPWLPRQRWKLALIGSSFWVGLIAVAVLLMQPFPAHPQLAPAIDHLVDGPRPVLATYADILLWTFAAQMAGLIGWYRSHSTLDFRGRYRLWAWASLVFVAWGFCAGTDIHTAIGTLAGPRLRWPIWRAEMVVWLAPAMLAGISVYGCVQADLRRCRLSRSLIQLAVAVLMATGAGLLYRPEMTARAWYPGLLIAGQFTGMGLLITGLWIHAWYVTYICADPPEPAAPIDWQAKRSAWASFVWGWLSWPFRRRVVADPKSRRRKKADEGDEEAAPKRRRKPAAKAKRAPRTRAKPKPEEEEAYEEEEASEEDWESTDETAEEEWSEEEYEEEETAPPPKSNSVTGAKPPANAGNRATPPAPVKQTPPAAQSKSNWSDEEEESEESDDEEEAQYRADTAHGGPDPFKGLSKRQRRDLKKQMRDQERQQGRR